jgi:hypothetical protein
MTIPQNRMDTIPLSWIPSANKYEEYANSAMMDPSSNTCVYSLVHLNSNEDHNPARKKTSAKKNWGKKTNPQQFQ